MECFQWHSSTFLPSVSMVYVEQGWMATILSCVKINPPPFFFFLEQLHHSFQALQNAQSLIFVSNRTLHPLTYLEVTFREKHIYKWAVLQRPAAPSPQTSNYAHQLLVTEPSVGSVYPPSFLSYSARSCGSLKASLFICCVLQSLTLAQHAKRKPILLFPVVLIGRACCLALH